MDFLTFSVEVKVEVVRHPEEMKEERMWGRWGRRFSKIPSGNHGGVSRIGVGRESDETDERGF